MFHLSKQLGFMPNIYECHLCNRSFMNEGIFSYSLKSFLCSNCNKQYASELNIILNSENLKFLNSIDKTNINEISKLHISSTGLHELYIFLISFMRCHIQHMNNLKGFEEIEKFYYEQ